ncbi:unnamed protein product, partial [Medioppia subpectinata]
MVFCGALKVKWKTKTRIRDVILYYDIQTMIFADKKMNRFGGQSSPWASGAPPMYGHNNHAPPPPPQYGGQQAYGQSGPWNVSPQMRNTGGGGGGGGGGWGAPAPLPMQHSYQPQQQRRPGGGFNMRPVCLSAVDYVKCVSHALPLQPMSGPTGKRGNQGGWEGPPNKRFNNKGNRGGGQGGGGGGNWRQGGGGGAGHQNKQNNRNFNNNQRNNNNNNRNNSNNREINRSKQNDTQLERCIKWTPHFGQRFGDNEY